MVITRSMAKIAFEAKHNIIHQQTEKVNTRTKTQKEVRMRLEAIRSKYDFKDDYSRPIKSLLPQPFWMKYYGLGHYQLLAKMRSDETRFFLINIGGPNHTQKEFFEFSEKDSLSLDQVEQLLNEQQLERINTIVENLKKLLEQYPSKKDVIVDQIKSFL